MKKKDIVNMKTIAVYCYGLYGLEIKYVDDYGDFIYYVDSLGKPHRKKIYFNEKHAYFYDCGCVIGLDEVLRCI